MKIFFDARYIEPDFHNGISRYSAELARSLDKLVKMDEHIELVFLIHDQKQLDLLPKNAHHLKIHAPTSAKELITSLILNKHKPDVVFSPMHTMGSLGRDFKLILTLHDLIYYQHKKAPTQFNLLLRTGWRLFHMSYLPGRIVLNRADRVVTVSETVKTQFSQVNMTKRPVDVVFNAPEDFSKFSNKKNDLSKNPRNLIYMGSFMPYKNTELLIKSLRYLPDDYTLHLLSKISPSRQAELKKIIPRGKKVNFHNGVTDKKYAELLLDRAVMVSASQNEGFGLPLVEAINMGVPCVVFDLPIFHEVAGDGALYFKDEKQLAKKISLLDDEKTRRDLVKKGTAHIKKFDWDKSAAKLLKIIQQTTTV